MFGDPQKLRAHQAAEDAGHRGIARRRGQAASLELSAKYPKTDERADRDHHPEAGDLEIPNVKERRIHMQIISDWRLQPATAEVIIATSFPRQLKEGSHGPSTQGSFVGSAQRS